MPARADLAGRRVPRRYLLDGEQVVTGVHQHWGKVAEPVLTALATLAVVLWLDTVLPGSVRVVVSVLWWIWLAVLARMVWRLLEWRHDWFVATDKRLLLTYGLITQKVAMMPLKKVTDMSYHRTPMGRLLGYGTFVMESAGQDQALHRINFIPNPDHTYRSICAEIFGVDDHDRVLHEPEDDGFDGGDGFDDGDDGLGGFEGGDDGNGGFDGGFDEGGEGGFDGEGGYDDGRYGDGGGDGFGGGGNRFDDGDGGEPGQWRSTEEAHRSIGREPSQAIPVRGGRPGQRGRRGRSVYRSPDLREDDRRDDRWENRWEDMDETGPMPQAPPWPPEEGL